MPATTFTSRFAIGDRVIIDGDAGIIARVIGIRFFTIGCDCLVAWMADGAHHEKGIDEWRLEPAPDAP